MRDQGFRGSESRDSSSEPRVWCVPEFLYQRVALQRRLDDAALHPFAAAVYQPHLAQAGLVRRSDVFLDH